MIITKELPKSPHSKRAITVKCDDCQKIIERRYDHQVKSFKIFYKDVCRACAKKIDGLSRRGKRKITEEHKQKMWNARKKYEPLTISCKRCQKEFSVPYGQRDRMYCGKICQVKSIKRTDIRETSECVVCKKEFKHYGARILCSRECGAKYMAEKRIGENNPNFIPRKDLDKSKCPECGTVFSYTRTNLHKGQKRFFCSLKCTRKYGNTSRIKNKEQYIIDSNKYDQYLEYESTPYPVAWNKKLKDKIKERDGHKCQLCGGDEKFEIHHIDYNKQNCEEDNLVTLCKRCHTITHHNRHFWQMVFDALKSHSKIVKKGWGFEIHFANNNKYCLKYLVFFKGKRLSLHKHLLKQELFSVWGKFECYLKDGDKEDYFILKTGDKVEIKPGVEHQLRALTNSIITEVSTTDYPEDSIRLEKGD